MLVTCPNCKTKYNLPDEMFREGAQAKCTVCSNVFPLSPPSQAPDSGDLEDDLFAGLEEEAGSGGADFGDDISLDDEGGADLFGDDDSGGSLFDDDDAGGGAGGGASLDDDDSFSLGLEEPSGKKKKKKKKKGGKGGGKGKLAGIILLVLLLLAGGGFAGLWFLAPQYLSFIPFLATNATMDEAAMDGEAKEGVIATEQIKDIALRNVRQYTVANEKAGQVFVIEGEAVNNFPTPKELIKVRATLYDAGNVAVEEKTLLCGNTVSLFQLQVSSREELDANLANKVGILTNNTSIPTGGGTPFMVVFYDPPDTVREFGVEVVAAKDPPEDKQQ